MIMFVAKVHGLTFEAKNFGDIAAHLRKLSETARVVAQTQNTVQNTRYYDGKRAAYMEMADFIAAFEIKEI